MSVNNSSVFNSLLVSNVSSSYSILYFYVFCLSSQPSSIIYTALSTIRILLLLPLCITVLHHGFRHWRQKRSSSSVTSVSHLDCLTYHIVTMELLAVLGYTACLVGVYVDNFWILYAGMFFVFFVWHGEMFFHVLTSVERYLAVVHPITFLKFKSKRGIVFGNLISGSVWLLSLAGMGFVMMGDYGLVFPFGLLVLSVISVSYCSLSVFRVLARPGPGDQSETREKADPSKQRALHTIVIILTALLMKFAWDALFLEMCSKMDVSVCKIIVSDFWFTLPNSLVLPVLFLHRAGRLACWKTLCCLKD